VVASLFETEKDEHSLLLMLFFCGFTDRLAVQLEQYQGKVVMLILAYITFLLY